MTSFANKIRRKSRSATLGLVSGTGRLTAFALALAQLDRASVFGTGGGKTIDLTPDWFKIIRNDSQKVES